MRIANTRRQCECLEKYAESVAGWMLSVMELSSPRTGTSSAFAACAKFCWKQPIQYFCKSEQFVSSQRILIFDNWAEDYVLLAQIKTITSTGFWKPALQRKRVRNSFKTSTTYKLLLTDGNIVINTRADILFLDTWADVDLVLQSLIQARRISRIRRHDLLRFRAAMRKHLQLDEIILLYLRQGDSCTRGWFCMASHLTGHMLPVMAYIDLFIWGVYPSARKVVPCKSQLISKIDRNPRNRDFDGTNASFKTKRNLEESSMTQQNVLMLEWPSKVFISPTRNVLSLWWKIRVVFIRLNPGSGDEGVCVAFPARSIMKNESGRSFYIHVRNFSNFEVLLSKIMKISQTASFPSMKHVVKTNSTIFFQYRPSRG